MTAQRNLSDGEVLAEEILNAFRNKQRTADLALARAADWERVADYQRAQLLRHKAALVLAAALLQGAVGAVPDQIQSIIEEEV